MAEYMSEKAWHKLVGWVTFIGLQLVLMGMVLIVVALATGKHWIAIPAILPVGAACCVGLGYTGPLFGLMPFIFSGIAIYSWYLLFTTGVENTMERLAVELAGE